MVFSVELIPDAELDRAVRDDWDRLLGADLPSSGRNPAPSNRPHMTLAVRDRLDPSAFAGVADLLPVTLELAGVVLLGHRDRYVLARHVVVSAQLLAVHRAVAEIAGRPEPRYSNTGTDRWTPHITLARGLTAARLATAMRLVKAPNIVGQATGARVWDAEARSVTTIR
ncbi:2'-5' RNA ligase family protein [Microbacterium sp. QXD-8]|uniref:2'-5' RNA ligase family protein n=1 Tax=Microbacterium psychrotolerans TaxID=3068321 RepID=A0ABU0Z4X1_9MICO|nr:2'-5' RNA ligase family protein [Microbacterium sp. QXD-8]MDQ7879636.1 2'-5' RNA ligase family protein [Microbacterium sp. QXD-8]